LWQKDKARGEGQKIKRGPLGKKIKGLTRQGRGCGFSKPRGTARCTGETTQEDSNLSNERRSNERKKLKNERERTKQRRLCNRVPKQMVVPIWTGWMGGDAIISYQNRKKIRSLNVKTSGEMQLTIKEPKRGRLRRKVKSTKGRGL